MTGLEVILTSSTFAASSAAGIVGLRLRRHATRLNDLAGRLAQYRSELRKANKMLRKVHVHNVRLEEQVTALTEELAAKQEVVDSGLHDLLRGTP